jgi:hypothetical protein
MHNLVRPDDPDRTQGGVAGASAVGRRLQREAREDRRGLWKMK